MSENVGWIVLLFKTFVLSTTKKSV